MEAAQLFALLGVWLAAIMSPGPDLFQIIRIGSKSRAAGVMCALGIMVGSSTWIIASLAGLSALIQTVPEVLTVLQIVGGFYLLYMGISAILSGTTVVGTAREVTPATALRIGIATNLSNPKAVLFFGAVFAQFVRPGMGWEWAVAISVLLIATGFAWFVGFALTVRVLARPIEKYGHVIDTVTGAIFIALGLWMLWEGIFG